MFHSGDGASFSLPRLSAQIAQEGSRRKKHDLRSGTSIQSHCFRIFCIDTRPETRGSAVSQACSPQPVCHLGYRPPVFRRRRAQPYLRPDSEDSTNRWLTYPKPSYADKKVGPRPESWNPGMKLSWKNAGMQNCTALPEDV